MAQETVYMLPYFAEDFMVYMESIKGKSGNTTKEYRYDLLMFFRCMKQRKRLVSEAVPFDEIDVGDFPLAQLKSVNLSDLYAFLNYLNTDRGDKPATRARKVACLHSFFKYATQKANILDENPAAELESPKLSRRLPKYLELEESQDLLDSVDGEFEERDTCILTFFLNCGMRLSELVGINVTDIRENTLTVVGKGDKERTIYLNDACLHALAQYMAVRPNIQDRNGRKPLFVSKRKKRISPNTVQYTVKKYIMKAGLDPRKYSVHKLRHTAATLMYNYGNVDIRALQEILGHESVSTTQIYTHTNNAQLKEAVSRNPLAGYKKDKKSKSEKEEN